MVLWMAGLHIPETYLAALVQVACRRNNWPLDKSTLYTRVTEFTDPDDIEYRPEAVSVNFALPVYNHSQCLPMFITPALSQKDVVM